MKIAETGFNSLQGLRILIYKNRDGETCIQWPGVMEPILVVKGEFAIDVGVMTPQSDTAVIASLSTFVP